MNPLLLIMLVPAAATVALFFVDAEAKKAIRAISTVATGLVLLISIGMFVGFGDAPATWTANADGGDTAHSYKYGFEADWIQDMGLAFRLGVDGMGLAMVLLTALIIFAGVMVSYTVEKRVKEYYICLLALVTGVFGVFVSLDLFFYYFFYELAVIPMFLLIGVWGSTTKTVDQNYATMKLVLLLSAGAVMALVGLIAVWADAGTFNMVLLEEWEFSKSFQMTWFPVIFLGFAALVPMWPLHSWSPAGHAAAPAAVSMLHAGVLMKLGAFGILRLACTYFPQAAAEYLPYLALICCMNIVYGGLVAISQRDMKLIIGYSSSSHMGYVLLGIASMTMIGIEGAVFLMFAHGVMTALTFALIGWFYDQTHTRMLDDLGGLMKVMPFAGTLFIIASMASAGLPGFANFASELMVIIGAWESGSAPDAPGWLIIPAVLAVWGLVITGVYLLRAIKDAWFGEMDERWKDLKDQRTFGERAPFILLTAVLLLFGFWPQGMLNVVEQGAKPLVHRIQAGRAQNDKAVKLLVPVDAMPRAEDSLETPKAKTQGEER
ncbi:MAG: NADH-quinone oxidoreductase subunit M [Planctomycetota bacterium]|nr:NADH-quinone oxidoreductase subunit M [Planctomycetota bacterium]